MDIFTNCFPTCTCLPLSLNDWLTDWLLTDWLTDWLTNTMYMDRLTDWLIVSLINLSIECLIDPLTDLTALSSDFLMNLLAVLQTAFLPACLSYWMTDWLIYWLKNWLVDWVTDWLNDWLAHSLIKKVHSMMGTVYRIKIFSRRYLF